MTPSKGTDRRTVRIGPQLWQATAEKAAQEGKTVSEVIRRALEQYVAISPLDEILIRGLERHDASHT